MHRIGSIFHFHRAARHPLKVTQCKWAQISRQVHLSTALPIDQVLYCHYLTHSFSNACHKGIHVCVIVGMTVLNGVLNTQLH
jgi:hypothetical protein